MFQGLLSYTMINYYKLGFDAADMNGNSRTGKCQVGVWKQKIVLQNVQPSKCDTDGLVCFKRNPKGEPNTG